MHFGFSYIGLLFLLMLIIPNLIWTKNQPADYELYVKNENKILLALERAGEALVTCIALIFSDFNIHGITAWSVILLLAFIIMLFYEAYWIKYFKSKKTMQDFYSSFCGIPVAGASLPVAAFFLLGIYGRNPFMIMAVIILGIGHIGIHLNHKKELEIPQKVVLKELDWHNYKEDWPVIRREAVRGIIRNKEGKYAFVQSRLYGECKFPGGGVEEGESRQNTLVREVAEETGMVVIPASIRYFGETLERKKGYKDGESIFEQRSYYYFCEVEEKCNSQRLTDSEKKLGYELKWMRLEEALRQMRKVEVELEDWLWKIPWLRRDSSVMEILLHDSNQPSKL